jgi:hypothetical protein
VIEKLDEVLRKTKRGWTVITHDPVLAPFLAPGGDYCVLVTYPDILDEDESNSGDLIAWRVEGNVVVLTHADTDKGPVCKIKRPILDKVVALLAQARNDPAGIPSAKRSPTSGSLGHAALKEAFTRSEKSLEKTPKAAKSKAKRTALKATQ